MNICWRSFDECGVCVWIVAGLMSLEVAASAMEISKMEGGEEILDLRRFVQISCDN